MRDGEPVDASFGPASSLNEALALEAFELLVDDLSRNPKVLRCIATDVAKFIGRHSLKDVSTNLASSLAPFRPRPYRRFSFISHDLTAIVNL